ncbi:MAG: DUF6992 family protein [Bacteroidia bacterium]
MRKSVILLAVFFIIFSAQELYAQSTGLNYQRTVKTGMYTLLGWSVLNLGVGTYGNLQFDGRKKYFHQMNAGWNMVNLALAASSFYTMGKLGLAEMNSHDLMLESNKMGKIFLFNGGLDVGYMAFGGYLIERGKRLNNVRLHGYGQSLILQGAFLFVFDLAMYGLVNQHFSAFDQLNSAYLAPASSGIGIEFRF